MNQKKECPSTDFDRQNENKSKKLHLQEYSDDISLVNKAFINFLKNCIRKNKHGICDYTNKKLAENFSYHGRKYSESQIKNFLNCLDDYGISKTGSSKSRKFTIKNYLDNPKTEIRSESGHYLDNNWTLSGHYLDNNWTLSGHYLDNNWTLSGHYLDNNWTLSGHYLDNNWTITPFINRSPSLESLTSLTYNITFNNTNTFNQNVFKHCDNSFFSEEKIPEEKQEPEKPTEKPFEKEKSELDALKARFDEFFEKYNLKIGKQQANIAFSKAVNEKRITSENIEFVFRKAEEEEEIRKNKNPDIFIPTRKHANRWLDSNGWEDDLTIYTKNTSRVASLEEKRERNKRLQALIDDEMNKFDTQYMTDIDRDDLEFKIKLVVLAKERGEPELKISCNHNKSPTIDKLEQEKIDRRGRQRLSEQLAELANNFDMNKTINGGL